MICPNCNHERTDKDDPLIPEYQCPNCGIVYAKFKTEADKAIESIRHGRDEMVKLREKEARHTNESASIDNKEKNGKSIGRLDVFIAAFFASVFFTVFYAVKVDSSLASMVFMLVLFFIILSVVFYIAHIVYRLFKGEKFSITSGDNKEFDFKSLLVGIVMMVAGVSLSNYVQNEKDKKLNTFNQQKIEVNNDYESQRKLEIDKKQRKIERERKEAECKNDINCIGDKLAFSAGFICQTQIEKRAKYDFKWTDGFLGGKFSHYKWKDSRHNVVTVAGDKIMFQNGFGAMQNHIYFCDIDINKDKVVGVRVKPGRL